MENRRSRDSFTKSLKKICQQIADQNVFDVEYRYDFLPGIHRSRLRVNAVWVVGSYARGALQCGDLDLVADVVSEKGSLPLTHKISRHIIGRHPDVRLYIGTPKENSSGVEFPEEKLVWSPNVSDWNVIIDNIPVDQTATRFERPHDILPLRKEQIVDYGHEDLFEKIVKMLDREVLSSQWIPISEINVLPDAWSTEATKLYTRIQQWCGKKTQEVMPFVIEWFHNQNSSNLWHKEYGEKTRFKIGGAVVLVGRPYIELNLLNYLSCSTIVIVPHLSRRGPNGLWIISRGAKHPLAEQFALRQAYYLAYGGSPSFVQEIDGWKSIHSIELFRQQEQVEIRRQEIIEEGDNGFDITTAVGNDLLSLISLVDIVEIDSGRYPITDEGQFFDEIDKIASAEEIVSALASIS